MVDANKFPYLSCCHYHQLCTFPSGKQSPSTLPVTPPPIYSTLLPDKVSIPPGPAPLLREVTQGTPVAPLPVAPAGPPAIQSSKPQAPNTCTYSLKPKAWAPSWDRRKPARGARCAHARTYTRVPGTAHGCARQTYPASQRPGWLRAQRSATAAGRRQPRLVGGPRRAARPPRAAACRSSSALPSPRRGPGNAARPRLSPLGLSAPTSWCPARLCSTPPVPPRRRRAHLRSGRDPAAAPEGPGTAGAAASALGAQFREGAAGRQRMPGSRGRWARLALAWHGSRWPLHSPAWAHVLPRRSSGALCRGSGAGEKSKHLAGFPQPRPGPAS